MSAATLTRRGPKKTGIKFGPKLRQIASEKHVSQAELARIAQVNVSTINRLFNGEVGCNEDIAAAIAGRLGVLVAEIALVSAV